MFHTASLSLRAVSKVALRRPSFVSGSTFLLPAATTATSSVAAALSRSVQQQRHFVADASHDDFAPKKKTPPPEGSQAALDMIAEHVKNNPVMLYMKGNPSQPMCGFSAKVVNILQKEGIDFSSVNVLDYPSIREGVKQYSQWPTIPQLYINGEFIGGCDIVTDMHTSGELSEVLKSVPKSTD